MSHHSVRVDCVRSLLHMAKAALGALVILASYPAMAAAPDGNERAIKALLESFAAKWHDSDAHGLSMFWSADGDFINPDGLVLKGRREIEGFYSQAFSMGYAGSKAAATVDQIRWLKPDLALVDGAFEITGATGSDHRQLPAEKGRYTVVLKKENGHWWIVANREMEPPGSAR